AVGAYANPAGGVETLIERWDGSSWVIANSPNIGYSNFLTSVACVSASDCWAVGFYDAVNRATLIVHWDGNAWTIVESPNATVTNINILSSVACASASDCWTVGRYFNDNYVVQTLTEHWDGHSWSIF